MIIHFSSPIKFNSDSACDVAIRSNVYKERFPKVSYREFDFPIFNEISSYLQAKAQMEERLAAFIDENGPLSGGTTTSVVTNVDDDVDALPPPSILLRSRQSICVDDTSSSTLSQSLALTESLRLISDGATRFLHHQIVELAADCLCKSRDDTITSVYFCDMSQRLEDTLIEVCYNVR